MEFGQRLFSQRIDGTRIPSSAGGLSHEESAYRSQRHFNDVLMNHASESKSPLHPVGFKVAGTNVAIRQEMGLKEPVYGVEFDRHAVLDGGRISISEQKLAFPLVEVEVAFVMHALPPKDHYTALDIIPAVKYVLPAFEIPSPRIEWPLKNPLELMADNAAAAMYVLGNPHRSLESLDLTSCIMTLQRDGQIITEGVGSNALGNPLNACVWLANKLNAHKDSRPSIFEPLDGNLSAGLKEHYRAIQEDTLILSGTLGTPIEAKAGDFFHATIEGLGTVSVHFEA